MICKDIFDSIESDHKKKIDYRVRIPFLVIINNPVLNYILYIIDNKTDRFVKLENPEAELDIID